MTMADVRCPMCSTINPADATVCSVCGARLKPMIAGEAESLAGPPEPQEGGAGDWLGRIRREGEGKAETSGAGGRRRQESLPTEPEAPRGEEPEREAPPLGPRPPSRPLPPSSPPAPAAAPPPLSPTAPPPSGRIPPPSGEKPAVSQAPPFMGISKDLLEGAMPKWLEGAGPSSEGGRPPKPAAVAAG